MKTNLLVSRLLVNSSTNKEYIKSLKMIGGCDGTRSASHPLFLYYSIFILEKVSLCWNFILEKLYLCII